MNEKFREFINNYENTPSVDYTKLIQGVNMSINKKIRQRKQVKIFGLSILSITSFSVLIPIFSSLNTSLSQSGVYNYLSFFADKEIALAYWKELILIMAETIPFTGIILMLSIVTLFAWAIVNIRKETRLINRTFNESMSHA